MNRASPNEPSVLGLCCAQKQQEDAQRSLLRSPLSSGTGRAALKGSAQWGNATWLPGEQLPLESCGIQPQQSNTAWYLG